MIEIPSGLDGLDPNLALACEAAASAGQIVRSGYQQVHEIDEKGVGDLVSKIDYDADVAISSILKTDPSGAPILSEELTPDADPDRSELWIADPLDGSTAYLMNAGESVSSVLIARVENGQTQLGVCLFPMTGEWFYAVRGQGAWKNGRPLKMHNPVRQLNSAWVEMNRYGNIQFETPFFAAAQSGLRSKEGARIVTSNFPYAGVAMRIAEQTNGPSCAIHDNNPASLKQGPWDIAAAQLIFEEAGGVFLNPRGDRISAFVAEPIIVAPTPDLAEQIIELTNCIAAV